MRKLLTLVSAFGLSGTCFAADPAALVSSPLKMPSAEAIRQIAVPAPAAPAGNDRWWSVNFVGSAHKAQMTASLKFMGGETPDMDRAGTILLTGTNDESAHLPDAKLNNGGKPEELWYGKEPRSLGGVLSNYEHFKFNEAYARLGTICHLTQDQAVPTHAANIKHGTNDSFEGYAADGNKVKIPSARDSGEMEPYAYYQDLQDDTRRHLAGWVNPRTGAPYWVPAKDAPPLGTDATFGSWGSYGPNGDVYSVREQSNIGDGGSNNNQQTTESPEIRLRQLTMAGAATVGVLRSASKRLPPLVQNLSVTQSGNNASLKFTVLDNRSRKVTYGVSVYLGNALVQAPGSAEASLNDPASPDLMLKGEVTASVDLSGLPPGTYTLDARVTDADGNTTPDEVNSDDIGENDTKAAVTVR